MDDTVDCSIWRKFIKDNGNAHKGVEPVNVFLVLGHLYAVPNKGPFNGLLFVLVDGCIDLLNVKMFKILK